MQPVMKALQNQDGFVMWVIRGKSTSLDREEAGVFVLEMRGVGTAVGGISPHLRVVLLVQVGMVELAAHGWCAGSCDAAWLSLLVRAGVIPG